jgi:hypothetical protein
VAQRTDLEALYKVKDSEIDKGKESITPPAPHWIELRTGSLGPLHRFGLGIGCVHHMSNELGKIGKSRFRINDGGVPV